MIDDERISCGAAGQRRIIKNITDVQLKYTTFTFHFGSCVSDERME